MKNKLFFISVLACILIFSMVFISCSNPYGGGTYTVIYQITGPQTIADHVTYSNETGNFDSITIVPIPWEKTITVQGGYAVGCSATIYSSTGSTYTAKIFINGKEKFSSSSSTGHVSVTGVVQ